MTRSILTFRRVVVASLVLAAIAVLLPGNLVYRRTDGEFYWRMALHFGGFPVARSGGDVVYSLNAVDTMLFFRVSAREAERTFAPSVSKHVGALIGYIERDDRGPPDNYMLSDLQTLTGQAFGRDPQVWRRWWERNKPDFRVDPSAYERVRRARVAAERAARGWSYTEVHAESAAATYGRLEPLRKVRLFLIGLASVVLVTAIVRRVRRGRRVGYGVGVPAAP